MPAGEDGDEDAPADGGSPGWNSRIGSDKDVDLLLFSHFSCMLQCMAKALFGRDNKLDYS
jgi:hypothetical protein